MIVVTDMQGNPITTVSNPRGLFKVISQTPNVIQKCIENWTHLDATPGSEPQFIYSRLGLLGTRGLIRLGTELKEMVIIGGCGSGDCNHFVDPPMLRVLFARGGIPMTQVTPVSSE